DEEVGGGELAQAEGEGEHPHRDEPVLDPRQVRVQEGPERGRPERSRGVPGGPERPASGISRLWGANGRARIAWLTTTRVQTFEPVPTNGRQNDERANARTTGDSRRGTN